MRSRNIKPGFFENEELAKCPPLARILYIGLWCYADREGTFEWRPERIKAIILPYDRCDIEKLLDVITSHGFVVTFNYMGKKYGHIPKFKEHQRPHPHEAQSTVPTPPPQIVEQDQCHCSAVTCNDKVGQCPSDIRILGYSDIRNEDTMNTAAGAVIDILNELTGSKYTPSNGNRKHIEARLKDGYTVDDFRLVITHKLEDPYFKEHPQYYRPSTLFGSKFESYLNAAKAVPVRDPLGFLKPSIYDRPGEEDD